MTTPPPPAPSFRGGRNIALKLPPALFEAARAFYVDTLGLPVVAELQPDVVI